MIENCSLKELTILTTMKRKNNMERKIYLKKVNWDNYGKVLKLRVTKEQENYIASNKASLIHAFLEMS